MTGLAYKLASFKAYEPAPAADWPPLGHTVEHVFGQDVPTLETAKAIGLAILALDQPDSGIGIRWQGRDLQQDIDRSPRSLEHASLLAHAALHLGEQLTQPNANIPTISDTLAPGSVGRTHFGETMARLDLGTIRRFRDSWPHLDTILLTRRAEGDLLVQALKDSEPQLPDLADYQNTLAKAGGGQLPLAVGVGAPTLKSVDVSEINPDGTISGNALDLKAIADHLEYSGLTRWGRQRFSLAGRGIRTFVSEAGRHMGLQFTARGFLADAAPAHRRSGNSGVAFKRHPTEPELYIAMAQDGSSAQGKLSEINVRVMPELTDRNGLPYGGRVGYLHPIPKSLSGEARALNDRVNTIEQLLHESHLPQA